MLVKCWRQIEHFDFPQFMSSSKIKPRGIILRCCHFQLRLWNQSAKVSFRRKFWSQCILFSCPADSLICDLVTHSLSHFWFLTLKSTLSFFDFFFQFNNFWNYLTIVTIFDKLKFFWQSWKIDNFDNYDIFSGNFYNFWIFLKFLGIFNLLDIFDNYVFLWQCWQILIIWTIVKTILESCDIWYAD